MVYVTMAACVAPHITNELDIGLPDRSEQDATGKRASAPEGGIGIVDAARQFIDAMATPVRDARAAPLQTRTADCSEGFTVGSGDSQTSVIFAVATFPGRSPLALARTTALVTGSVIPGFTHHVTAVSVKQDTVAALCEGGTQVTFVLPGD